MNKLDKELGYKIYGHLTNLGIETPANFTFEPLESEEIRSDVNHMTGHFARILDLMGLTLTDDSLADTPRRIAKLYIEDLFKGLNYSNFPRIMLVDNKMQADELICLRNVQVHSLCEHHFVPFIGRASIGYLPKDKVIGLSKIPRVVDFFSRRPQVQERLTSQIVAALQFILGTDDVACVIEADHMCVKLRGASDPHSFTITSKLGGKFKSIPELRSEFLTLTKNGA